MKACHAFKKAKSTTNGFITDLEPGDKVRIDDTALFKKGTERKWCDEVHVIIISLTIMIMLI